MFLLSRRRRIQFVNPAWEALTGIVATEARGLLCSRNLPAGDLETVANALCPPAEVMNGRPLRCRRALSMTGTGPVTWDIDFFPFCKDGALLGVLGTVHSVASRSASSTPLPDKLLSLPSLLPERYSLEQLPSKSPAWRLMASQARLAGQASTPVLILGEAGTGKHWLARVIHYRDSTRQGPFVSVDCARLAITALERLFNPGTGILRAAQRGTIYFKQCQLLPRDLQHQLLRWINDEAATAPRITASCHADAAGEVRAGRFVEGLYCTLAALAISVPPLRERLPDLQALVEIFIRRAMPLGAAAPTSVTPAAMDALAAYAWPGNLLELLTVLRAACAHSQAAAIDVADLPAYLRQAVAMQGTTTANSARPLPLDSLLEQVERRLIVLALHHAQGNKSKAAEILGVWRPRLLRRMQALGISDTDHPEPVVPAPPIPEPSDSTDSP